MKTRQMLMAGLVGLCGMAHAEFVIIGNPGNAAQSTSNREHTHDWGDGFGAVPYTYQISKHAVSIADWKPFYDATDIGKQGSFRGDYDFLNAGHFTVGPKAPAIRISLYQAAQYCNWLTTGNAAIGAYTIDSDGKVTAIDRDFRNEFGMLYAMPSEDEWFKAAYYNGTTGRYSLFADGGNDFQDPPPKSSDGLTGWNYDGAIGLPWAVDKGTEEKNGTFNMMGNVYEWMEDLDGWRRGGSYGYDSSNMRSSYHYQTSASYDGGEIGFRVVAIPEPGTFAMLGMLVFAMLIRRRFVNR